MRLLGNNTLDTMPVNSGTLLVNGTNSTGAVTVNSGVLGGSGSVSGAVTVGAGAHVAPGASVGTFGVGALDLSAGSVLDYEFGTGGVADRINVTGLLTIGGGTLNLSDLGGLSLGTYTLINYGSLNGSIAGLTLGAASELLQLQIA